MTRFTLADIGSLFAIVDRRAAMANSVRIIRLLMDTQRVEPEGTTLLFSIVNETHRKRMVSDTIMFHYGTTFAVGFEAIRLVTCSDADALMFAIGCDEPIRFVSVVRWDEMIDELSEACRIGTNAYAEILRQAE